MKTVSAAILLLALYSACTPAQESKNHDQDQPQNNTNKKDSPTKMSFDGPIQVDTSAYVMFPLSMQHDDGSLITKSRGDGGYCWNIIFLDTRNQQYHLLDSGRKMLIKEYDRDGSSTDMVSNYPEGGKYLFYEVITHDANKDGKLDERDPTYLFMSDQAGNNFKQISPENYYLRTWKVIKQTGKVLIYAVSPDSKRDDNENEQITPFAYDLKSGVLARKVFSDNFVEGLKRKFDKQWAKK